MVRLCTAGYPPCGCWRAALRLCPYAARGGAESAAEVRSPLCRSSCELPALHGGKTHRLCRVAVTASARSSSRRQRQWVVGPQCCTVGLHCPARAVGSMGGAAGPELHGAVHRCSQQHGRLSSCRKSVLTAVRAVVSELRLLPPPSAVLSLWLHRCSSVPREALCAPLRWENRTGLSSERQHCKAQMFRSTPARFLPHGTEDGGSLTPPSTHAGWAPMGSYGLRSRTPRIVTHNTLAPRRSAGRPARAEHEERGAMLRGRPAL